MDCFIFKEENKNDVLESFKRTKFCRFKASDRLKFYSTFSNWIFTILSLLLIVSTLVEKYEILCVNEKFLNFYELSLAITILVFFQVISNSNHEIKSLRFHQCGIEISKILQKLEHINTEPTKTHCEDKIKRILNEYSSILKRYENHDNVDYYEYKLSKIEEKNKNNNENESVFILKAKIFLIKYVLGLSPQLLLLIISIIGFYISFSATN